MQNKLLFLVVFLLIILSGSYGFAAARIQNAPGIEVAVISPTIPEVVAGGYYRVDVTVSNKGSKSADIELHLTSNDHYSELKDLSNSAVIQPGGAVTLPIYIPPCNFTGNYIYVHYNDRKVDSVQCSVHFGDSPAMHPYLLVSRKTQHIEMSWRDNLPSFTKSTRGVQEYINSRNVLQFAPIVSNMAVQSWSTDWLAYTAYSAVILSAEEMGQLPSDVKTALDRYTEAGGTLIVDGAYNPAPAEYQSVSPINWGKLHLKGFGSLVVIDNNLQDNWPRSLWGDLSEYWQQSSGSFNYYRFPNSYNPYNNAMQVVPRDRVPVGLLFFVLIVFVIVAGPLTTFIFARKEKRMRIYWIVPACSLLTTLLIIGVALASEGISSSVRSASVAFLDENANRMSMVSNIGYFCPVPPNELKFDNNIQLMLEESSQRWNIDSSQRSIDFTSGQSYRGWINARVPTYFKARSSTTCRDHIAIRTEPDGGLSVVNNLKGNIKKLYISDDNGVIYNGTDLTVGQSTVLSTVELPAGSSSKDLVVECYSGQWQNIASGNFPDSTQKWLKPGRYIAVMEDDQYLQRGIDSYKNNGNDLLILGISKKIP